MPPQVTTEVPGPTQETTQSVETPVENQDPPVTETPEATQTVDENAYWEWVQKQDPREIARRHRQFANVVGQDADQLERRRAKAREVDWARNAELQRTQEELRSLRKQDPVAFAEKTEELEKEFLAAKDQALREQAAEARAWSALDAQLVVFAASLPMEVQKALAGKNYDLGDAAASRRAYVAEANKLTADFYKGQTSKEEIEKEVKKRLASERKAMEEGIRKEVNGQAASQEVTLELGTGTPVPDGPMTQSEYDQIKGNKAARLANRHRFIAGVSQGLITHP